MLSVSPTNVFFINEITEPFYPCGYAREISGSHGHLDHI